MLVRKRNLLGLRGVQGRHDGLFNFGARKSFRGDGKFVQVERLRILLSLLEMNSKNRFTVVGRLTKNISSNRPLRINSGGSVEISLAVATTKTLLVFSDIQVRKLPSTLCVVPVSPPRPASPFSISSIHKTHGAIISAVLSDSRKLRSVSPWYLS